MSKRMILTLICLALGAWLTACAATDPQTEESGTGAESGEAAEAPADAGDAAADMPQTLGAELAAEAELTAIADLAGDPASFEGKTLRIQGTAVHRCGSGCSLTLSQGDAEFMVKSDTEVFQFPEGWKDGEVVAEGTIQPFSGCAKHKKAEGEADHAEHHGEDGHADEVKYVLWVDGAKLVKAAAAEAEAEAGTETEAEAETEAGTEAGAETGTGTEDEEKKD